MTTEPGTLTVHRDIPFHDTTERTLHLDVYEPAESGVRPAVLFVHGGGFVSGDKGQLARLALDFADRGYLAVTPEYRLGGEASFPAALVDVKAAIEWLRADGEGHGVDPQRVAVAGHSAGGNLATLAAVTADEPGFEPEMYPGVSSRVQAAVGYAGVYDVGAWDDSEANRHYLGGGPSDESEAFELASPLGQAAVGTPPTLLLHGSVDEVVSPEQSNRFYAELDAVTEAELDVLTGDGADHMFPFHTATYERTRDRTEQFLEANL